MIVGAWEWEQYEYAFSNGLAKNSVNVIKFSTTEYLKGPTGRISKVLPFPFYSIFKINNDIIKIAKIKKPDAILFWRPIHIFPSTLKSLHKEHIITISYNNDDPFGPIAHANVPWHHHLLWFWYLKSLNYYKLNFFYRKINCNEALKKGVNHAEILMPYFIPEKNRPQILNHLEKSKYDSDVVFVGHYEPDGREKMIRALINEGIKTKIWGGKEWNKKVLGEIYDVLSPIRPAYGDEYSKAISG
jgi:hypothetical protein